MGGARERPIRVVIEVVGGCCGCVRVCLRAQALGWFAIVDFSGVQRLTVASLLNIVGCVPCVRDECVYW